MSKKRFTVILTIEQQESLNYLAWLEKTSPSAIIRNLIENAYKNKKSKEKQLIENLQNK